MEMFFQNHAINNDLLHTPDGMRDTYGAEMARKEQIMNRIRSRIHLYGYEDIQTPAIEFYDVFSSQVGTTPVRELYKLLDNDGNNIFRMRILRSDSPMREAFSAALPACRASSARRRRWERS